MKKRKIYLSLICAVAINATDIGNIDISSSTINDLSTHLKTEASTINTIDEKSIEKLDPKNINDLLQTIPGITADLREGNVVEIHIRGVGQQEFMWEDTGVVIVIDGVPVLQNGGKVKFNIDEIESIKVIKGSASYLYGNTALAGAVIITTKKNKNKNGGSIKLEAGSYGYKNAKASIYKGTKKYSFNLNSNYIYSDGYWDKTENKTKSINGKAQYYIDDSSDITFATDITRKYEESDRGSVTGVTEAENNPKGTDGDWSWNHDYYTDLNKYFITYNKDFITGGNLKINTYYYEDLYSYESAPYDSDNNGNDDYYSVDNTDNIKQSGVKTEYKNKKDSLSYMIGLDAGNKKEYTEETTTNYYVDSRHKKYYEGEWETTDSKNQNYAVYSEAKYKINKKLTAIGNIRVDYDDYDYTVDEHDYNGTTWSDTTTNDTEDFKNVSYRIGGTYQINKVKTLFANISTGFRNPTVSQIISIKDYNTENNTNLSLDTQTAITYEIGMRGTTPFGAKCEASIFRTDTKDIISKVDGTYYWGSDYTDNVGDSRSQGFELSLKGKAKEKLSYTIAYTYLDAYYTKHNPFIVSLGGWSDPDTTYDIVGNQLPRVPHHKLDVTTTYKATSKLDIMGEVYAQSRYYADETNLVEMPGFAKVNIKATYSHKKNLEFFVKIDNLLDKQYYRTVYLFSDNNENGKLDSEDASITVDPGRVYYAGLKYKF